MDKEFTCPECSRTFGSRRGVGSHCIQAHGIRRAKPSCTVDGCDEIERQIGLCHYHYSLKARWGVPGSPPRPTVAERIWRNIVKERSGCWRWVGTTRDDGYGRMTVDGRQWPAHALVYSVLVEPIPEGLEIDHLCRNHSCVRPDHLEPVTHAENVRRWGASFTECPQGHPYTEENTGWQTNGNGCKSRYCRTCNRERNREWWAANRA